ncbi:hypothetical protein C3L33_08140, partial [Rhododendron williamsianum]
MTSSRDQSTPYPSAARIADSPCFPQYTASLKCTTLSLSLSTYGVVEMDSYRGELGKKKGGDGLEEFKSDKSKCQEYFDIYKECKKKEVQSFLKH